MNRSSPVFMFCLMMRTRAKMKRAASDRTWRENMRDVWVHDTSGITWMQMV